MASKKSQEGIFRIKDINTGLYYSKKFVKIDRTQGWKLENLTHWVQNTGTIYTLRGSAERMLTQLTRTKKHNRDTDAKRVLFGNKETASYVIVECEIKDKE